jgi:hypothetical protein
MSEPSNFSSGFHQTLTGARSRAYFGDVVAQTSDKAACQYHPNPAESLIVGNQLAAELRARLGW